MFQFLWYTHYNHCIILSTQSPFFHNPHRIFFVQKLNFYIYSKFMYKFLYVVDESKDNTTEKEPETQPDEKAVKQEEVEIPEKKPEEAAQTIENAAEQQPTQG